MSSTEVTSEHAEIERLRARVAALEAQLAETEAWANGVVAEAQDKTYWLDRWHVDLNKLVDRPSVTWLRAALSGIRRPIRAARRLARRLAQ